MKTLTRRFLVPLGLLAAAIVLLVAGCGSDDDPTTASTEAETEATAGGGGQAGASLTIEMGDFFFRPQAATAQAGETTIEAPNEGSVEHELVLFKTDLGPADLPTDANGEVDEEELEGDGEEIGEIDDVEAGESKSGNFNLTPGKYVMFCNLPGHYAKGMYGSLTVGE